jgi:hypothetical protein
MGLKDTIARYGYAWFLNKVNWDTMFFWLSHHPYMQLNTPSILGRYDVHYQDMRGFQGDFVLLEDFFELISQHHGNPTQSYALLSLLVDFCLQAFQKKVFWSIQSIIRPSYHDAALSGSIMLYGPVLEKVIYRSHLPLHLVGGNQCSVKTVKALFVKL